MGLDGAIMTCKDAVRIIPLFLDDDLDNRDLSDFLRHIDNCEECKEELTIQFLVKEGMNRLESGNTFNLKMELDYLLKDARKRLNTRRNLVFISKFLQVAVVMLAAITIILAITIG